MREIEEREEEVVGKVKEGIQKGDGVEEGKQKEGKGLSGGMKKRRSEKRGRQRSEGRKGTEEKWRQTSE